jgi:alanine adding enzyme
VTAGFLLDTNVVSELRKRRRADPNLLRWFARNEAAEFAKDGDVLPAAASLFVEHPREVIYLFSGSVEQYKPFYASALIQHDAMLHFCVEHGLSRYNFYGIDGVFDDPDDEGRGVLEFKQGFNGYVEELPGEFVLPVKPVAYAMKQFAHKLLSR